MNFPGADDGGTLPVSPSVAAAGSSDASTRLVGSVKSFQNSWGFLVVEGLPGDVFIHMKENPGLGSALQVGENVEFEMISHGPDGTKARAVDARRPSAGSSGGDLSGVVSSFKEGWGLLESSSLEGKLFFGLKDCPALVEQPPVRGDEVTFNLGTNPKDGRPKAVSVAPLVRQQAELVGHRVRGIVRKFTNGWGFASSSRFEGNILLGKNNCSASGLLHLQVGDAVEFEVAEGAPGKFEAVNISQAGGAAGQRAPSRVPPLQNFARAPPPPPGPVPAWVVPCKGVSKGGAYVFDPADASRDRSRSPHSGQGGGQDSACVAPKPSAGLARLTGTVKTFRDGWGFLVSDQVEGDVYLKLLDNPSLGGAPLAPGEPVAFELARLAGPQRNNGARAINVVRLGENGRGPVAPPAPQRMPPPPPAAAVGGQWRPAGPNLSGGQLVGTLAVWRDGWGFLESPAVQGQVFLGLRDNAQLTSEPQIGEQFTFELAEGTKGRMRAVGAQPTMAGKRVHGTVSNLRDGWGFATADGIAGNVMLGKNNLVASGVDFNALRPGLPVEFLLVLGARGYEAAEIRLDLE